MDSTRRFSNRVDDYVRYRPGYPAAVAAWIADQARLHSDAHVVDLGSGTGLLSRLFLDAGYRVTGVEPNAPMRRAGVECLAGYDAARVVAGTAEATGLADACCDLVVSGQAFHWFDPGPCRSECLRIARPPAPAAMVWNERRLGTAFMDDYEALLLRHAPEYEKITASHVNAHALDVFFAGPRYRRFECPNAQSMDFAALLGRLMSSSYAPLPGAAGHNALVKGLKRLFALHAQDEGVTFDYRTVVIIGALAPPEIEPNRPMARPHR